MSYYVDTNIFDYSALAHPTYGKACKCIIDDIQNRKIKAYCGFLVPIELLGFSCSNRRGKSRICS